MLFLIIVGFSLYNYFDYLDVNRRLDKSGIEVDKLNEVVVSLKKEMKEKIGNENLNDEKAVNKISEKIEFINGVIYEKNFSWSELFYSLEKASPKNISITSIKPSYESKKITISGLAKHSKDIATLVDNLKGTSFIKKSYLLKEGEKIIDKKYKALSFDIEAVGDF